MATTNNSSPDDEVCALERVGAPAVTLSYSGYLDWLIEIVGLPIVRCVPLASDDHLRQLLVRRQW